ncbi:MAG: hypothetical protein JXR23_09430 [Pontiellaceae bacterium]|nr:hypothetical protein [Pontiellaceae bacterium]
MKLIPALLLTPVLTALFACTPLRTSAPSPEVFAKIEFDLSALDADGLIGPPDGKVSLAYEFAIPDTAACRAEVLAIDPSIQISTSRGRIGATADQCLCIGETHQPNYMEILHRLAELPYVERIARCWFE